MKISRIIKATAELLGLSDVAEYLSAAESANGGNLPQADAATLSAVNTFKDLCNLVIGELASTYIPMVYRETLSCDGKIYYSAFTKRPVRVLSLKTADGVKAEFVGDFEYIRAKSGTYTVEYEYIPDGYTLTEEIGFAEGKPSEITLAYGTCAEYCVKEGRFQEAVAWRKRYTDAVEKCVLPKSRNSKGRVWL